MKSTYKHALVACAALSCSSMVHAGFLYEAAPAPAPATATSPVKARPAGVRQVASTVPAGRDVDLSAKVDRMSKMNRQRIDLESRVSSRITQSGAAPGQLQILRGLGRGVTIEDALRQILPSGWSAFSDQDLPAESVDWDGTRTWPMALHSVLAQYDMRAHIDWDNQELMLFVPAPAPAPTPEPVATVATVTVDAAAAPAPGEASAAQPAAAPLAEPSNAVSVEPAPPVSVVVQEVVWTLSTEKTLRENLRTWASSAGWNLVWSATYGDNVIDYPVDAQVSFTGELVGVDGAMAKVISAYADADRPLEIEFFKGNKVVEVRLHRIPDIKKEGAATAVVPPRTPAGDNAVYVPISSYR